MDCRYRPSTGCRDRKRLRLLWLGLAVIVAAHAAAATPRLLEGLANVQTDGSLHVGGEKVWLYGTVLPAEQPTTCRFAIRPPFCAARSVLALDYLVKGFVHCEIVAARAGALFGICTVAGRDLFGPRLDLGAAMIRDGWARAAPGAPAFYQGLEDQARTQQTGLWGDRIINFR